ncbi:hypothetical protein N7509_002022 [Penicillium cosmopolitanum]|uniref:ACB domain-containing protein n=1 Tax=Penicillium cosmopolitanum TaxID=1131564 RepID=A0A9W9W8A2_9EURO|nr:uncharacterized protein N7509_002022 [Penicillium cosmopolitanum]KAJ5408139.1 hypothetical protein N7509_002022 [Penicillium cosmopolitanum]
MSDLTAFITALEAAQNGAQYSPEVQKAAAGINTDDLKKAYAAAEAQGNKAQIEDPAQSAALKAGFEFAAKLVLELQSAPDNTEKTNLYVHYKIGNGVKVDKPGMFDLVKKHLFSAYEKVIEAGNTAQGSQVAYIKQVVDLIAAKGLN